MEGTKKFSLAVVGISFLIFVLSNKPANANQYNILPYIHWHISVASATIRVSYENTNTVQILA
jgi:hypothetical protein